MNNKKNKENVYYNIIIVFILVTYSLVYLYVVYKLSFDIGENKYFVLYDDAMISMRYAYNFSHGHGLTWNNGEMVMGITNLGWTIYMALIHLFAFPIRINSLVIQITNLFINLGLILYVSKTIKKYSSITAILSILLLATNAPLFYWGISGAETSILTLIITAAFIRLIPIRKHIPNREYLNEPMDNQNIMTIPVLCAIAFFIRPDGLVFFVAGCLIGIGLLYDRSEKKGLISFIVCSVFCSLFILGVLLVQYLYYGDLLPNTFRLKISDNGLNIINGLNYLKNFMFQEFNAYIFIFPTIIFISVLIKRKKFYQPIWILIIVWMIYIIYIGGDTFNLGRFLLPIIPLLIVLISDYIISLFNIYTFDNIVSFLKNINLKKITGLAFVSIILAVSLLGFSARIFLKRENFERTSLAVYLNNHLKPADLVIGVFPAGALPYFMPSFKFHDMLGKSDGHISRTQAKDKTAGHNKWDYDYSLDKIQPQIIITLFSFNKMTDEYAADWINKKRKFMCEPSLWLDRTFIKHYRNNEIPIFFGNQKSEVVNLYIKDSLSSLPAIINL